VLARMPDDAIAAQRILSALATELDQLPEALE
jgi:hypothetical protein